MDRSYTIIARLSGGILLAFGIGLAILSAWMLERQIAFGRAAQLSSLAFVAVFLVIAGFCALTGYRLLFRKPNRYGSLLSSVGWNILAGFFGVLAVVLTAAAVWQAHYDMLIATLCSGWLGYLCVAAGRGVRFRSAESPVFPPEISLLRMDGFAPPGFRQGIEILNDNRTPMEFVVSVLRGVVGLSESDAVQTMLEIHRKGGILLPRESLEESKRIEEAVAAMGRDGGHALVCRAVSIEVRARTVPRNGE
jgi:ATP-dependent Clp protease adaptor protein ClpS